ncbi:MAG: hypothetical protein H6838_10520 [Planctomycetes bacterium]|nr:hypothetical protein [Planctomycetota bacterium]MCB9885919.1 hypothetical protein [Planctomycetota bacterium]
MEAGSPRALALAFSLLTAASLAAQQAPNLMPPQTAWVVTANPAAVTVSGTDPIVFQGLWSPNPPYQITVDIPFAVPQAGPHLLWLDGYFVVAPSSYQDWSWTIPGVGAGLWRQGDVQNTRDVAQWVVDLPAGNHTLSLTTQAHNPGSIGRLWEAELRRVSGPQLVPNLCFIDPQSPTYSYANFTIENAAPLANPVYMLFFAPATLSSPVQLPFGDQWLANPIWLGALNTPSWTFSSGYEANVMHYLIYGGASNPTWWQVVEYDVLNPLSTLRLGSPNRTGAGH